MSTITPLNSSDSGSTSRVTINNNFTNLNTDKVEAADIRTLTNKTINGANNTLTVRLNADVTGNLPVTNLNSGTAASSSTFWRGDGTWATPSSVSDATYAAKGVVQGLTDAATSGIVLTGGVMSLNTGTSANQIVKLNGSAQLPAVDGSLLTGINQVKRQYSDATAFSTNGTAVTQSIAANTLAAGKILRGVAYGEFTNGNPCTYTMTIAYGGTTIASYTNSTINISNNVIKIEYEMLVTGSTTAMISYAQKSLANSVQAQATVVAVQATIPSVASAQNLTIAVSSSNGTQTYRGSYAEVI